MDDTTDPNVTNPQDQGSTPTGGQPMGDQGAQPTGDQGAQPTGDQSTQPVQPAGGQPTGDQGAQPAGAQPAGGAPQKDLSGIMEENVDISGLVANAGNQQAVTDFIASVKIPEHPNTKFDEKVFVELLAGSISLTMTEKKRIIQAIPQLSQFQIDELMKIFDEEKGKFAELEKKHAEQVRQLEEQHKNSMVDDTAKQEEEAAKAKEQEEAENLKKSLGL
ncbi:hypothetical protein JW758_00405 [Candidatus Peregrinibacteria bacterium]|nr:hypothetical protein [Candidatus Peregrinibacteria bacterium]